MDYIEAIWFGQNGRFRNWGDSINPILIQKISGRKVLPCRDQEKSHYIVCGTFLNHANANSIIWGTGGDNSFSYREIGEIHAVRGPLTRKLLLDQGIKDVPDVYGDPSLVYPRFYNPIISKKYDVGIIPHYVDKDNSWVLSQERSNNVHVINIQGRINHVVDEIKMCEIVLSSSLHGLICADSYGVESVWIKLSDKIKSGKFKYLDYFQSVGKQVKEPVLIENNTDLRNIVKSNRGQTINISIDSLVDRLMEVCPFRE